MYVFYWRTRRHSGNTFIFNITEQQLRGEHKKLSQSSIKPSIALTFPSLLLTRKYEENLLIRIAEKGLKNT